MPSRPVGILVARRVVHHRGVAIEIQRGLVWVIGVDGTLPTANDLEGPVFLTVLASSNEPATLSYRADVLDRMVATLEALWERALRPVTGLVVRRAVRLWCDSIPRWYHRARNALTKRKRRALAGAVAPRAPSQWRDRASARGCQRGIPGESLCDGIPWSLW